MTFCFVAGFRAFPIVSKESPCLLCQHHRCKTHHAHKHSCRSPVLTVLPTLLHAHSHPHRAHAKPAVSSVISSCCKRGSVTLNSWAVEREGETCEGERKKRELVKGNTGGESGFKETVHLCKSEL